MADANTDLIIPDEILSRPYYNDYDKEKNFHGILFRPGRAVQARELTQLQTILQDQINRFGKHIFKQGSIVIGGQVSYNDVTTINLSSTYANTDIDVTDFEDTTVTNTSSATSYVRAQVLAVDSESADGNTPPTIMVKYLSGDVFSSNQSLQVEGSTTIFANVGSGASQSNGVVASIQDGIFFVNGYFVNTPAQSIVLEKYNTTPNCRVGLEIEEDIVDENEDTTLLDPAQESSNFTAPGATRLKITLTLAKRSLDSTDDSKFIEMLRIENGVATKKIIYPVYSELEKTLARRTNDESGSYTVRPFVIQMKAHETFANAMYASLDAGKAYVEGFEFETIAPTKILVERAREYENVSSVDIAMNYGNYVMVTNANTTAGVTSGGLLNINDMDIFDMHCVRYSNVQTANTTVYNASKIGTVRLRNLKYETSANNLTGDSHVFRAYIFDSILTPITGVANTATANTVQISNVANLVNFSANTGAYVNSTFTITSGLAAGYEGLITAYDGATRTITIDPPFTSQIAGSNSAFRISFEIDNLESIIGGSTTLTAKVNIDDSGKLYSGEHTGTILFEQNYNKMFFEFPQFGPTRAGSITSQSYQYMKEFSNRTFTAGVGTVTAAAGESFIGTGALSSTQKLTNFIVVVKNNNGSANISNGRILSFTNSGRSISIASNTATLDAALPGDSFTADVLALIDVNSGSLINPKSKTLITGNTVAVPGGAANATIGNTSVYLATGQVVITTPNRTPYGNDSLYVADVKKLSKVYDFGGLGVTSANLSSASDITSRYRLDNGQRENYYDHGAIQLKARVTPPTGPILICFDYYQHVAGSSDGYGYFSVDSYPDATVDSGYANISSYTSTTDGTYYELRDVIDFRPSRQNASNTYPDYTLNGIRIPVPNEYFTTNYSYYIPRIDKVVLTKDREFKLIEGLSARNPVSPNDLDGGMTLYTLKIPAYTFSPSNVTVKYHEWKRYTMRDIGLLDKRITNLEYYQTLSLLEKDAQDQTILDGNGLERTKYGTLVDGFKGHSIGDVKNSDYNCSIDFENNFCRPPFISSSHKLLHGSGTGIVKFGDVVVLDYDETPFIVQNVASFAVSVNDYLIARFRGTTYLNPESDIWVNTEQAPDVVINLNGENDAAEAIVQSTRWNDWNSIWGGVVPSTGTEGINSWQVDSIGRTTTSLQQVTRTGTQTTISYETITQSVEGVVVDVGVVPWARAKDVYFLGVGLRPNRESHFFFDGTYVQNFIQRPNELTITYTANARYQGDAGISERINANNGTFANVILGWPAQNTFTGNTGILYISEASGNGVFANGTVNSAISGASGTIVSYMHWSGKANSVDPGNTSSIRLQDGASSTSGAYVGNTIYFVAGQGLGSNATISAYNATTKLASFTPSLSVSVAANTRYSIGPNKTLSDGFIAGTFVLPSTETYRYRTGQRVFRIIDDSANIPTNSTMSSDVQYQAQGLIQTKADVLLSTRVPRTVTETVTETAMLPVTTRPEMPQEILLHDPLAQTFFVDAKLYPEGLFVTKLDLFFKAKDSNLPVGVKLHPTVNGYPDTSKIIPFSERWLLPADVRISESPDSSNTQTITTFNMQAPVYLAPGEYSLVVYSDTKEYEVWVAELGQDMINPLPVGVTSRRISEQPYIGSFFRSQNASTWTPYQNQDLMFVLHKCVFTPGSSGTVLMNSQAPSANKWMDVMMIQSQELNFGNTSTQYSYKVTSNATGALDSNYTSVNRFRNIHFDERKVVTTNEGSANIKVIMTTNSRDVSPVIDQERSGIVAVENIIDNAGITNASIVITDGGAGYTTNSNISVTISGGNGSSANAMAFIDATTGKIVRISVDAAGSGYTGRPTITVSGGGASTNATINIASELDAEGGLCNAKYISRIVTLADGFAAGDIRLYVDAYKPQGTDLAVYYKIKNEEDADSFYNKPYQLMTQATLGTLVSENEDEYIEYEYRASMNANSLSYVAGTNTFRTFNSFAVKIVFLSENDSLVPQIKNLRVHALPESV